MPRPGRRVLLRGLLGALAVSLMVGASVATAVVLEVKDDACIITCNKGGHIPGLDPPNVPDSGAQTLLLLGSDKRFADGPHGQSHSDTMLLVRIDPAHHAVNVMSVPRDLKIAIPGGGTQKLNAAYFIGGPKLTYTVLKNLLGTKAHPFEINQVVNINFGGFNRLLTRLGCVYVDVDRHYFNDNNPPVASATDYATINVKAGYQKLCGQKGLDYVRYRHEDDDVVRAARQQDFLRQAKDQIGLAKVFEDRKKLLQIMADNTQSTLTDESDVLSLLKSGIELIGAPVRQITFPSIEGPSYVTLVPGKLKAAVRQFMNDAPPKAPKASAPGKKKRKHGAKKKKKSTPVAPGLTTGPAEVRAGQDEGLPLATHGVTFPVYYPTAAAAGGTYVSADRRAYKLRSDTDDKTYQAYRIVAKAADVNEPGQYYGLQGTTWKNPPILAHPTATKTIEGRHYKLFGDSKNLRVVSWETPRAVYWVSNTILGSLTNKQMLGIAQSARHFR